ncbi:MAG: type II secretion system secretin GspD [Gammaproteobacteria bacterium]|nr:type II secretion system secretin GspD [Gammaproteobacteria bacterium]
MSQPGTYESSRSCRARRAGGLSAVLALVALALLSPTGLRAEQATITPNYKDADIRQVIEAVGEVTGKNFILDPRVKAQVTMLSAAPMTPDAFYEAFLSILSVYGFVAVPAGDVVKILPDANVRQMPGAEGEPGGGRPDDIVTRVIPVQNVAAAQLVPILRPLIPQYGHLAAHPPSNLLIISDRASNVDRMMRIVARIDQSADQDYEVIRLEHASSSEIVKIVGALNQGAQQAEGGGGPRVTVVADERTNSVLVTGDKTDRLRYRALITHLDTPLEEGGDTQVRYLRYTDAVELATKLQSQYSGSGAQAAAAKDAAPPAQRGDVSIWADESTNALIITAPPKTMKSMMAVIDKLDIRRAQVLVEAIIVEVSSDKASELGVTWAIGDKDLNNAVGVTKFDNTTGVTGIGGAILSQSGSTTGGTTGTSASAASLIGNGLTMGVGRLSDSGLSFVALIEALESDGSSNIIGTPVLVTLDNEEAEIQVGQEVPFVTGQYTDAGTTGGNTSVNPFQTIQREQVGLTLKLTPQINEGDAVRLKVEQEISQLLPSAQAVDLITSNRSINTSVIVEDGGTLVLGGLIQDQLTERQQRVPILGRLPLIGALFRSDATTKQKTNLMVFIKPTILRDNVQAAFETNAKYNYIRDQQLGLKLNRPRLMPLTKRNALPELDAPDATPEGSAPAGQAPTSAAPEAPVIDLRAKPEPPQ